jgi:hypothetical protein
LLVGLQVLARGHYQTHSIYLFLANIVNFSPERAMASSTDILKQCNSQVILPLDQKKKKKSFYHAIYQKMELRINEMAKKNLKKFG